MFPVISGIGTALPEFVLRQEQADELLRQHYSDLLSPRSREVLHQVLLHPSIKTRHVSVDSLEELLTLKNEDPDHRVARFTKWSVDLSCLALERALQSAGVCAREITALIINTCTGYLCPGLSSYVIERMNLSKEIAVYDLVGAGCGGAVPNLKLAEQIVRNDPKQVVACISVEVCSATFEMANDMGLLVSNAIFGDGAAAVIVCARKTGLALEKNASVFYPEYREYVRYIHRQGRLYNQLDPQLPKIMRQTAPGFFKKLLSDNALKVQDIRHWALHPGGDRILSGIVQELQLPDDAAAPSRQVLLRFGNMSSPSVLFVLDSILGNGVNPGEWILLAAYGAGMSIHAFLLQAR